MAAPDMRVPTTHDHAAPPAHVGCSRHASNKASLLGGDPRGPKLTTRLLRMSSTTTAGSGTAAGAVSGSGDATASAAGASEARAEARMTTPVLARALPLASTKTVYCVRHGHAAHNAEFERIGEAAYFNWDNEDAL